MLIFQDDFETIESANRKVHSFNYGEIQKSEIGAITYEMNSPNESEYLFYNSENEEGFANYTIEIQPEKFKLYVYFTHKHKMIEASKNGDLELFTEYFSNTQKMKGFALSTAITHNNWNIVDYLISNFDVEKNPIWEAIRYDKVEILKKLIEKEIKFPKNWLAYCIYNNSIQATNELLLKRKKHLEFEINDLNTAWLKRELYKSTETAKLVKSILS